MSSYINVEILWRNSLLKGLARFTKTKKNCVCDKIMKNAKRIETIYLSIPYAISHPPHTSDCIEQRRVSWVQRPYLCESMLELSRTQIYEYSARGMGWLPAKATCVQQTPLIILQLETSFSFREAVSLSSTLILQRKGSLNYLPLKS